MLRRLETFRLNNTEDNTMLNYFNEKEIHPVLIDAMHLGTVEVIFSHITPFIGPTSEFELTEEEERECYELKMQSKQLQEQELRLRQQVC